ncbi:MAG: phosphatase domain-containing protein [Prolixibacteraceae bacterium]
MHNHIKIFNHLKKKHKSLSRKLKVVIKHRLGWLGVPLIVAYRGFGNDHVLFLKGHVTEDKGLAKPETWNSRWQNALSMIKRYSSDEIPHAKVFLEIEGRRETLVTDENGLYESQLVHEDSRSGSPTRWIGYSVRLQHKLTEKDTKIMAKGEVLIPGSDVRFGVISDIDDTILVSHSTRTMRKLFLMMLHNSRTRKPFPGVDAFYQALYKGASGSETNPFFYVSSSEWNLYDLLDDFCAHNNLPKGVFLLRELENSVFKFWKSGGGNHQHKLEKIRLLFQTYPEMPFVLIGDSGQHDPEIYDAVAREFPGRVKAIYIRDVSRARRDKDVKEITRKLQQLDITMLVASDTIQISYHAAELKLISHESIAMIVQDAQKDLSPAPVIIPREKTG